MTVHRYHPDEDREDNPNSVLWDDCDRCHEHTRDPINSLDGNHLVRLMLQEHVNMDSMTDNEWAAVVNVHYVMDRAIKVLKLMPIIDEALARMREEA